MIYATDNFETDSLKSQITKLKNKGFKDKEISIILSTLFNYNKNDIYKESLNIG
jgi:hypothetical protein